MYPSAPSPVAHSCCPLQRSNFVSALEFFNSRGVSSTGVMILAESSAKFHSPGLIGVHRSPWNSAGIGGALIRPLCYREWTWPSTATSAPLQDVFTLEHTKKTV